MSNFPINKDTSSTDPVKILQDEIAVLEADLALIREELKPWEEKIHARLGKEISYIRELFELYKKQKKQKKEKRQEQKKKGKNYKEPTGVFVPGVKEEEIQTISDDQKEIKRIYRNAVVQVHPDKFHPTGERDKVEKANLITAQLNEIYKKGDLEELISFCESILSGTEFAEVGKTGEVLVDYEVRLAALKKKREKAIQNLEQMKASYLYGVIQEGSDPEVFLEELYIQCRKKIDQLEKRTRKGKGTV